VDGDTMATGNQRPGTLGGIITARENGARKIQAQAKVLTYLCVSNRLPPATYSWRPSLATNHCMHQPATISGSVRALNEFTLIVTVTVI
jgi:hypothetical protein